MTAATVPDELVAAIGRLTAPCDMPVHRRRRDDDCPNSAAWIDWYACYCADRVGVATCHIHHQDFVRHTRDYICPNCMMQPRYLDSEQIRRPA